MADHPSSLPAASSSKGGRPPLAPEDRRTHRVHLSVDDATRDQLVADAHHRGLPPTRYAQHLLVERLAVHRVLAPVPEDELVGLRKQTDALNRAVHRLHILASDQPGPLNVNTIQSVVDGALEPTRRVLLELQEGLASRGLRSVEELVRSAASARLPGADGEET